MDVKLIWGLRVRPKIPQNLFCPIGQKLWDIDEKRLQWASVVRATDHNQCTGN